MAHVALSEFDSNPRYAGARASLVELVTLCAQEPGIDLEVVHRAIDLMVKAHLPQEDRPDGAPYVSHPASVALRAVKRFGVRTTAGVVAALLHDAPEDQAEAIVRMCGGTPSPSGATAQSLEYLGASFGPRVKQILSLLTNPDFNEMATKAQLAGDPRDLTVIKNELYKEHFLSIMDADCEAFLIKLSDFSDNGLSLGKLEEGPKKNKLRAKYGPVILAVLERLEQVPNEGHPLSESKMGFAPELAAAYQRDYAC